jgi:predicted nucleic acid-binding Zn ribbon protein
VRSYTEESVEACPKCGKRPRRLVSAPAIVFKGSGWYKTDSRATSSPSKGSSDKDGGKSDSKADAKSESKPDGKTESKPEGKPDKTAAKSSEAAS